MALGYDRIVGSILVESLGEKKHKCVTLIYTIHNDIVAINAVVFLSFILKYNLHLVGNHAVEDAMSAIITLSVNLCTTVHDNLCHRNIVGKGAVADESDS